MKGDLDDELEVRAQELQSLVTLSIERQQPRQVMRPLLALHGPSGSFHLPLRTLPTVAGDSLALQLLHATLEFDAHTCGLAVQMLDSECREQVLVYVANGTDEHISTAPVQLHPSGRQLGAFVPETRPVTGRLGVAMRQALRAAHTPPEHSSLSNE